MKNNPKIGRPKVSAVRRRIKLNTTIPACLVQKAKDAAQAAGTDLSHFVEEAIRKQIESESTR